VLREIEQLSQARASKRRARIGSTVAALLFAAGLTFAAAAPKPPGTVVKAPFVVEDRAGNKIISIYEKDGAARLDLYNAGGVRAVAVVSASVHRSYFQTTSPDGKWNATLGVEELVPYYKLSAGVEPVPVLNANARVSLDITNGRPYVRLSSSTGHGVLQLMQGADGGGELEIAKPGGDVVVRAGISPGGVGRVEAYPLGNPLGSAIVGKP